MLKGPGARREILKKKARIIKKPEHFEDVKEFKDCISGDVAIV